MKQKLTEPLGDTDHCRWRGQDTPAAQDTGTKPARMDLPSTLAAWPDGHPDAHSFQCSGTRHDRPSCHHKIRLNKFKRIVFSDHSKIKVESTTERYQENPRILLRDAQAEPSGGLRPCWDLQCPLWALLILASHSAPKRASQGRGSGKLAPRK